MKKLTNFIFFLIPIIAVAFTGCYKLQTDYKYNAFTLDPHINMNARAFMVSRGNNGVGSDTIFKLMQQGIDYAGIDTSEYEKQGRTYIFLHNNAIRTTTGSGSTFKVTGGFFYDYPIIGKDASGNVLKSKIDPTQDSMRPALTWNDYPQDLVKNYFLYLIIQGDYSFENLEVPNISVPTLLPAGIVADPGQVTKLSRVVTKSTPNPDAASASSIVVSSTAGSGGFDPEGKLNLRKENSQNGYMWVNDRTPDRSAGYFATNGKVHVFDKTVHPFRYSW
jgi:hypothetical protein